VEDLMTLVQACRNAPDMEARLRETLNMARDAEKWRNLMRMLTEKVRLQCVLYGQGTHNRLYAASTFRQSNN
jgi:hypothetical protein